MTTSTDVLDRATDPEYVRWRPGQSTGEPRLVILPRMLLNVLDSLCEGKSNRAIADDWGIAEDTVKTHLKRLFVKMGARDRVHAVVLVYSDAVDVRSKPDRHVEWVTPLREDVSVGATLRGAAPYPPRL